MGYRKGKTGTVENFILIENEKKQLTDHSTFIAFAPAENPEIVVSVFIENGYWGSRWAAPIASLIIEKYLTDKIERKWLENRMVNGSLQSEYEKPYKFKTFTIRIDDDWMPYISNDIEEHILRT